MKDLKMIRGMSLIISFYILFSIFGYSQNIPSNHNSFKLTELEDCFCKYDTASYKDYRIRAFYDSDATVGKIGVRKHSRKVYEFSEGFEQNNFGLFPFLGSNTMQLIVEQYPGGNAGYYLYRIIDLSEKPKILYSSDDYDELIETLHPMDIDNDGIIEFSSWLSFRYDDVFAGCVFNIILKYSSQRHKYIVANKKDQASGLQKIDNKIAKVKELSTENNINKLKDTEYSQLVLEIVFQYIYSGRQSDGWQFFNKWYVLANKKKVKEGIVYYINHSKVYKEIYGLKK